VGDGTKIDRYSPVKKSNDKWKMVTNGSESCLAIKSDGTLWGWGNDQWGTIGLIKSHYSNSPQKVGSNHNWKSISAGSKYSLAIDNQNNVWFWGDNSYCQGTSNWSSSDNPTLISTPVKWRNVYAANQYSVGISIDSFVYGWGYSYYNSWQFGPTKLDNQKFKSVDHSENSILGVSSNGELFSFGTSTSQIGSDKDWVTVYADYQNPIAI
jgi:alpha-tubulin suppressor-like RCC1 family protein